MAILTSVCIILLIGVFFLFHSPVMQKAMEKSLHKYVTNKTGGSVRIKGLHLSFPSAVRIDSIDLLKNKKVTGKIRNLDMNVSLWLLPFSELRLSSLLVQSVQLLNSSDESLNSKADADVAAYLKNILWPKLSTGIYVEKLNISKFQTPTLPSPLSLEGSISMKKLGGDINLSLIASSKEYGKAHLKCLGRSNKKHIYLKLDYTPPSDLSEQVKDITIKAKTNFRLKDLKFPSSTSHDLLSLSIEGDASLQLEKTSQTKIKLNSLFTLNNSGFIRLDKFQLLSPFANFQAYGSLGPKSPQAIDTNIFQIYANPPPISIDCSFSASPKIPHFNITNPIKGSFKGLIDKELSGAISLDTVYKSLPLEASSAIHWNMDNDVEFSDISLESRESILSGNLHWNIQEKDIIGQLDGSLLHFPLSAILNIPIQGDADFKIDFEKEDNLHFDCMLQNISTPYAKAFKGSLSGSISQYFKQPLLAINANFSNAFFQEIGVKELNIHLDSSEVAFPFTLSAKGMENSPFSLKSDGTVDRLGEFITINNIEGDLYNLPLYSTQAITIKHSSDMIELTPLQLFLGQGECQLDGVYSKSNGLRWNCKLFQFPIKPLQYFKYFDFIEGSITGNSQATISKSSVEGGGKYSINNLLFHPEMRLEETPLNGSISANINSSSLKLNGLFSGVGATPSQCSITIPIEEASSTLGIQIAKDSEISGSLAAEGIIQPIAKLILSDQDLLVGFWKGNFTLSGTWNLPNLKGSGEFKDGHYENLTTGLSLKNIAFNINAHNRKFSLKKGSAECGKKGLINFQGSIDLKNQSPLNFQAKLNETPILDIQEGSAIASGLLSLTGDVHHPILSGDITLSQLELLIPDGLSEHLPLLDVSYVYPQPELIEPKRTSSIPLNLNINIDIGNNNLIRGRGLNSKWKGNLKIEGKVEDPKLIGSFQLLRGEFAFSSTNFKLNEGKITFNGGANEKGFLSIKGDSKIQDINIYANLQGPLLGPSLSFSSSPSYPETEILSLILFGTNSQDISPFQALQVTQAVLQLSKGYSNLDIINRIRQNIGLDQLSITAMDKDPSHLEVHVGKYISQNVYLALAKSLSANTNLISASIELFNSFSLGIEHIEMYETQVVKDRLQAGWKHSY